MHKARALLATLIAASAVVLAVALHALVRERYNCDDSDLLGLFCVRQRRLTSRLARSSESGAAR